MADEQTIDISGQDIEAVAGKLESLSKELPPNQRVVIDWLLQRAASAPDESQGSEVQGYLYGGPPIGIGPSAGLRGGQFSTHAFPTYFNSALGLGSRASGVTGSISVGVRF